MIGSVDLTDRRSLVAGMTGAAFGLELASADIAQSANLQRDPTIGRKLIFEDNFIRINSDVWDAGPKAGIGPSGFFGRSAFARIGGEEGFQPYSIVNDPLASNGTALRISAKKIGRRMSIPNYYGNNNPEFQWVSGNLQGARSDGTVMLGWREAYFESRIRLPRHPLALSTFWLLNKNCILHPETSIEIDIIEHKGWELEGYGSYLHEWGGRDEHHEGAGVLTTPNLYENYYRFGMLVASGKCVPFFQGRQARNSKTGDPISWDIHRSQNLTNKNDMYWPLLTLALRADMPPPRLTKEDELTSMHVDYFRVYV